MHKVYPNKVMFFNFKYPRRPTEKAPPLNSNQIPVSERTAEQIAESLDRSIARTRREIADIVDCNDFDKFATFTFDPKKHPSCASWDYSKRIMENWLNNTQKNYGSFRYLLVPERQSNGNIHFHALLGGFTGKFYATNIRGKGAKQRQCYKITSWENSNGFADMEDIGNKSATGKYIGKYITKDITFPLKGNEVITEQIGKDTPIISKNGKRYFCSKGLKKPTKHYNAELPAVVKQHSLDIATLEYYENDYITVSTIKKKWYHKNG